MCYNVTNETHQYFFKFFMCMVCDDNCLKMLLLIPKALLYNYVAYVMHHKVFIIICIKRTEIHIARPRNLTDNFLYLLYEAEDI